MRSQDIERSCWRLPPPAGDRQRRPVARALWRLTTRSVRLVSILLFLHAAPGGAEEVCDPGADPVRAVRAVATGIVDADNEGDLARVLDHYAEDAVLMPPGEDPVVGRARIRPRYEELFASFRPSIESHVDEACVSGSLAFVRGRTEGRMVPKEPGEARSVDDAYLMLLRKGDDGAWRISHLMWHPRERQ